MTKAVGWGLAIGGWFIIDHAVDLFIAAGKNTAFSTPDFWLLGGIMVLMAGLEVGRSDD